MKRLFNFTKVESLPAGIHHGQWSPPNSPPYRIHLRLQQDGSGVLILNASTVVHLNPTAAEYAYNFIKGTDEQAAARSIASRYRVSRQTALQDFRNFASRIETLATTVDLDPVAFLDIDRVPPHSVSLTAPLRLDCALTYRLPPGTSAEYAPVKRVNRELATDEWRQILEGAWQAGIPHVTFTGGEPTLRDDLVALIEHAERLGQVCGLLTDGLKLTESAYLGALLQSGLDHLLVILQPARPESWKALEAVLAADIFVTAHLTLGKQNLEGAEGHLQRLADAGCKSLSLTFQNADLPSAQLRDAAADLGLALKHDLPVPYSADNPVTRETTEEAPPDGAGRAWIYVEPDGDVLPAQGLADQVLGNILKDPWEKIYHS